MKRTIISCLFLICLFGYGKQLENPVRFAIIGDRTGSAVPNIYEEIVTEVEALKPDFVLTVGDMIQGYSEDSTQIKKEWEEYQTIISKLPMPIYYTPGNHDITTDVMLPFYERYIGKPYYSFDIKGIHFVGLDVSRWEKSSELPKEQVQWLINDLKKSQKAQYTIVFYHKPFWFDEALEGKPDTLHSIYRTYGVDAVFNGHFHNYFSEKIDDVLYTALGSSGGDAEIGLTGIQYHYTWVTVDNNGITITPLKMNSVFSWDEVTGRDVKTVDKIALSGIVFENSASVNENMKLTDSMVYVKISNISDFLLQDTLTWNTPETWSVNPNSLVISVPAKEDYQVTFKVKNKGSLYPAPSLSLRLPYAEDRTHKSEKYLSVSRSASCYKANVPVIDGKISEPFWQKPITKLFTPSGGPMKIDSTYFYFAYDDNNLYLAAFCRESNTDSIIANVNERDGAVYGEDCVGYFLVPDQSLDTIYQIYFNPNGIVFDQKISNNGYYADREWNGNYEIKTSKGNNCWCIEARIPLEQFNVTANQGDQWGINFRRKQKRFNSAADWQVPIQYDAKSFGRLVFK